MKTMPLAMDAVRANTTLWASGPRKATTHCALCRRAYREPAHTTAAYNIVYSLHTPQRRTTSCTRSLHTPQRRTTSCTACTQHSGVQHRVQPAHTTAAYNIMYTQPAHSTVAYNIMYTQPAHTTAAYNIVYSLHTPQRRTTSCTRSLHTAQWRTTSCTHTPQRRTTSCTACTHHSGVQHHVQPAHTTAAYNIM